MSAAVAAAVDAAMLEEWLATFLAVQGGLADTAVQLLEVYLAMAHVPAAGVWPVVPPAA